MGLSGEAPRKLSGQFMLRTFNRIIKLLISGGFWFGYSLLNGLRQGLGRRIPSTYVVLYYHAITQKNHQRFIRQIEDLMRLTKVVAAETKGIMMDGEHYATVTFDDGFQCLLENAIPEFVKRKIPASIFIPTGWIGQKSDWIQDASHEDQREVVMTEEEIKRMPQEFITIGSHSINHSNLRLLGDVDLRRELIESKNELQRITGRQITLLSIPHGEYDQKVVNVARQAGYQHIFSSLPRLVKKRPYVIQRVPAKPSDWSLEFRLKILGGYQWLPFVLGLKRKLFPVLIKDLKRCEENSLVENEN
jgi:peptidoglycan/xylan/chitin deacetylase (PgdA/CDA1 family)